MNNNKDFTLGDMITLQRGFDITKSEQTCGIYPVVSSSGITSYHSEYKVKGPGVVIGRKGTLGTAFYIEQDFWPHDTSLWVKEFNGNDPYYVYCLLGTLHLEKLDSGSANPTLNRNYAHQIPTRKVPVDMQKNISKVIRSIDNKHKINIHICAELESMAKTLYDYWFTQFDFPNADGKPYRSSGGEMIWNNQLKREIPKGWDVTSIGKVTHNYDSKRIPLSQNERDTMKGEIPYYGATGIMDYVNRHIFDGQFVLIAEDGSVMDTKGNPVVQMIWGKTWVNNHAHVLQGYNGYSNELLYLLLQHIPVIKIMTGSIQKKINQDNLNGYKIPKIPDTISQAFHDVVKPMFEKIRSLQQENDELTKLHDWLLPMLMNGQATVE